MVFIKKEVDELYDSIIDDSMRDYVENQIFKQVKWHVRDVKFNMEDLNKSKSVKLIKHSSNVKRHTTIRLTHFDMLLIEKNTHHLEGFSHTERLRFILRDYAKLQGELILKIKKYEQ
jgi:hypothetical protein